MSWIWHHKPKRVGEPDWSTPAPSRSDGILEAIYAWERGCRGYDLYPYPVALEPVYRPLFGDGGKLRRETGPAPSDEGELACLRLMVPSEQKVTAGVATGWLQSLPLHQLTSFEILAYSDEIVFQLVCPADVAAEAAASVSLHFPLASAVQEDDRLRVWLNELAPSTSLQVVEFGLANLSYRPLRIFSSYLPDPLAALIGALASLESGEVAGVQVLVARARHDWGSQLLRIAELFTDGDGEPASSRQKTESSEAALAQRKAASPWLACALRVFGLSGRGDEQAFALCRRLGSALNGYAEASGNALLALDNSVRDEAGESIGAIAPVDQLRDVLARRSRRSGFLISADELVGLVHPPSESLHHPKLLRAGVDERSLPEPLLELPGALLGGFGYRGRLRPVAWPDEFRNRHAYLLGATRMGKSTLMLNLIAQDLEAGRGLCLIDPHGDLAQDVLRLVPSGRAGEVSYLDFGDREHPPAINLLQASGEWERRLVVSDLLSILHRLFAASWGDRLEHILRHVLLTLLCEPGHTLRDIRPLLSDKVYRAELLKAVDDPELLSFWNGEFNGYSASTFAPLYNKLGLLLSSPLVRNIVAQTQSKLHLSDIMSTRQVLIVNLNSAQVGEDNAHFLGAMLVSKIQIAAMQSLRRDRSERVPFTLYVDEFQNFVVSSFQKILSEAGKAGLSLVMANQFLEQLHPSLQSAILGNVGTLCSFRVSSDSARLLQKELAGRFEQQEIVSLNRGEAVLRLGQASDSVLIHTLPPPDPDEVAGAIGNDGISALLASTWQRCCRPRAEVEAELTTVVSETAAGDPEDNPNHEPKPSPTKPAKKSKARAGSKTDSTSRAHPEAVSSQKHVEATQESDEHADVSVPDHGLQESDSEFPEPQMFGLPDT